MDLAFLLQGYRRFREHRLVVESARYSKLGSEGQSPNHMVIACCDSRVAPEAIFDASPGEMFVVRNVANIVPPYQPDGKFHATSAALEYAVQSLKVEHIVVLGHGQCGGIKAALDPATEPLSPGDFIGKWMELLGPAAEATAGNSWMTDAERQTALERISIRNSMQNLRTFPCVHILESRNRLKLHGMWFNISSGELWVMDEETGDFSAFT